ncbi:MAG: hypothetical protein QHI38_02815 [Armatimonadota bacterium]|nr:hypothetical protein [Armatimonadota bacterium]
MSRTSKFPTTTRVPPINRLGRAVFAAAFLLLTVVGAASAEEAYRIRVENFQGGLVQVSLNGGASYWTVGKVTRPATARIVGFAAASYTASGTVAAIATHGIRIKTGRAALALGKAQIPFIFSIVPRQFAKLPSGYGGHAPHCSAVITDIDAGHSIFRNQSPYVGNPVYLERRGKLEPIPEDYLPKIGDVIVIRVERPVDPPKWVEFRNEVGGAVSAYFEDGRKIQIARVVRPVRGVGRYDGTTYTGVGAINTNHAGVITISTAPRMPTETKEGGFPETRGGFMIQPNRHAAEQRETSPQVMVIGPSDESAGLEGSPPLFSGCINLYYYPEKAECSYRVQVKIDDGDWEDLPCLVGKIDNAFEAAALQEHFAKIGKPRVIRTGVTALRILCGNLDRTLLAKDLAAEARAYTMRSKTAKTHGLSGVVSIGPEGFLKAPCIVNMYVDGRLVSSANEWPYRFTWDTQSVPNGWHSVGFEQVCNSQVIALQRKVVLIDN